MKTNMQTIKAFNVSWCADHEQYWQGHGIAGTPYTRCATGIGETLREALYNAFDDLGEQGINPRGHQCSEMLSELEAQVKEPKMLDWDIVQAYCECEDCPACKEDAADWREHECSVCAGEWHYYVSIDVQVEDVNESEGELQPINCDQCEMLSINFVACHETGCPNMGARWDTEEQEWVKQRECFECGYTVDRDDPCCSEPVEIEDESEEN